MKILLVDDDVEIIDELGIFLRRRGHDVVCVAGVVEALRALEGATRFDVVLTDLRRPDGSGIDVLRACRALPAPQPKAILMSGHAGPEESRNARDEGAQYVFAKPVPVNALLQALAGFAGTDGDTAAPSTPKSRHAAA
jgi:two-component system response regulator PilR (NtrC family)